MLIKDFINSRDICPICEDQLEIKITSDKVSKCSVNLTNQYLSFKSDYFNYNIDINTNRTEPYGGSGANIMNFDFKGGKFLFTLSLFCQFHSSLNFELYCYDYRFRIENGIIDVDIIIETLRTEEFTCISSPLKNTLRYVNMSGATVTTLPYFDYSNLSLPKIREKLKTYLLLS